MNPAMLKLIRKLLTPPRPAPPKRPVVVFRPPVASADPQAADRAPTPDWELGLIPHAQRWFDRLPPEVQPEKLCLAFPRIGNRLSLLWPSASLIDGYFDDLLSDKRGGRRGFPEGIAEEIARLRAFRMANGDLPDTFFGEPDPVAGHGVTSGPGVMERTSPGFQPRF